MKRFTPVALLLIGAVLLTAGGCRPDFAPYNRLTSLRVLAIQSEPPTPATGETATLKALVFTPTDDPSLTYSWSWCPYPGLAGDGRPCLVNDDQLNLLLQEAAARLGLATPSPPPLDLGTASNATLPNALDPMLLSAFCAGGLPLQINLTVKTDTDQVEAVFTTRWRFDSPLVPAANPPANTNPLIDKLTAEAGDIPEANGDPAIQTITLRRNVATPIRAAVTTDQAETYVGPDADGIFTSQTERLFLTWFVETGVTQHSRTSYNANSGVLFDELLKNQWTPAVVKDYSGSDARLFVVIHDSRNGIGWRNGIVHLDPTP